MEAEIIEIKHAVRHFPFGAELRAGGVHFRVWAGGRRTAAVVLGADRSHAMENEGEGWFSGFVPGARAGMPYRFAFDGEQDSYPDPASRFQPEGPHGPSVVTDPAAFRWTDKDWAGIAPEDHVLYEMHIGTFTPEGTWRAAAAELSRLRDLGVTTIEMMPIADFAGRFGWGYDGVNLFAPTRLYGEPDDLKYFVNRAHEEGLAVILDVVYNHLGPEGNYLSRISPEYFGARHSEWGPGYNFDGENNAAVRQFATCNAAYWISEFHFDGLRLDATQQIYDLSRNYIVADISSAAQAAAQGRRIFLLAENEPQEAHFLRGTDEGGFGMDALYNDDFHHSAAVAMTGRREAYYSDYFGTPQEFVSLAKHGFLYQGQFDKWQRQRRGTPSLDRPGRQFVVGLENHDQVANSGRGLRMHQLTSPGRLRAMTALMMLLPQIPMLFQGQEFGASAGFYYFADHAGSLAADVREGRRKFMSQFPSSSAPDMLEQAMDPESEATFNAAKLDLSERQRRKDIVALHRDLLTLRRDDRIFRQPIVLDGAVLGPEAFVLRYMGGGDDRLLLVNLGADLVLHPAPEPLLAPPEGRKWQVIWSSEDPRYNGCGTPAAETPRGWHLPGHAALALKAENA